MRIPQLMFISDGNGKEQIIAACEKGIPAVQLREKEMESRALWELAKTVREKTSQHQVFFTVNERLDIALAVEADGIHLPEAGMSPAIPKKIKPSLIVGVSVHSVEAAFLAEKEGADYLLFGPVFPTPSKAAYGPPQGLDRLRDMASRLSIPVIAVGGIAPALAKECLQAGAYGVAAIGAFMQAADLKKTIDQFLETMNETENPRIAPHH